MEIHKQTKKMLLALDFDGVIADSAEESLVVGYNTYTAESGNSPTITSLSDLEAAEANEAIRLRSYMRSGEDFVFLWKSLAENVEILRQAEFDRFKTVHASLGQHYNNHFYALREALFQSKPDEYYRMNPLYPGMAEFLLEYDGELLIITNKQLTYIHRVLKHYQIEIPHENTFRPAKGQSKRDIIEKVLHDRECQPENFHFVEDQVDTLLKTQSLGIKRYLAGWGYNDEEQAEVARENGILVLALSAFFHTVQEGI